MITWVSTQNECNTYYTNLYTYHDPSGTPNLREMSNILTRVNLSMGDIEDYFGSFSEGNITAPSSGTATPVGDPFDTPTHGHPPSSPQSRALAVNPVANAARNLGSLGDLVAIGKMIGDVWNVVKANTATNTYSQAWVGAVPQSYSTDWTSLTGWQAYSVQPQGSDKPSCDSNWGNTYADWTLAWEGNGNYIENARILASATAAWGMNVNVDVTPSTAPVNVGTASNPVAQLQFSVAIASQGGLASTYTETVIVTFDAGGNYAITSTNGAFCGN